MVKCIIIDDDKVFTKILEHFIAKVDFLSHVKTYHSSTVAFNEISKQTVDLIFLDMEIPGMHGLEFLEALAEKPRIVFVTRSGEYGAKAFEYEAVDYLQKPVILSRFLKCSQKIKNHFQKISEPSSEKSNDGVFIKVTGFWQKILFEDINLIKAENNHVIIKTNTSTYKPIIKLKNILAKLPEKDFLQVHRSYVVKLNKITKVDKDVIEVCNKTIPVSKTYIHLLYKTLNLE